MLKLNSRQVKVLIALNAIIIVIFSVVLALNLRNKDAVIDTGGNGGYVHSKIRNPQVSANSNLKYSINIGGNADDKIVAAFSYLGKMHLFINTASSNYDFDKAGTYMAVLDFNGKTEQFLFIGDYGVLIKAINSNNGYMLGFNEKGDKSVLFVNVNFDGQVLYSKKFSSDSATLGVLDIFVLNDFSYALAYNFTTTSPLLTEIRLAKATEQLEVGAETRVSRSSSLQFIALYDFSDYIVIVANIDSITNCATFAKFVFGGSPTFYDVRLEYSYTALDVMPHNGGFLICFANPYSSLCFLTVSSEYVRLQINYTDIINASSAKLIYSVSGGFFVYVNAGSDVSYMRLYSSNFSINKPFSEFSNFITLNSFSLDGNAYVFAGTVSGGIAVVRIANDAVTKSFTVGGSKTESMPLIFYTEGALNIVCNSTSKDGDIVNNFGGTDVWLARCA